MIRNPFLISFSFFFFLVQLSAQTNLPVVDEKVVFEEENGILAIEAEYFYKQSNAEVRAWYITHAGGQPEVGKDPDPAHIHGASNHAYVEILPDTRTNHDEKLIQGENFINQPGKMAVLHYKVFIHQPGRYYVWVRTHSTGTEDNGLHVGIDGTWPEHGQRMQWIAKRHWHWDNRQRTQKVHTGVPMEIYLDIEQPGAHEIQFSMREDGFEFDKFILARDPYWRPVQGPETSSKLRTGSLPLPYPAPSDTIPTENGDGTVALEGELKQWHKVTLNLNGPFAHEQDKAPNPFRDYRMTVRFTHESGSPSYVVPGYFAADGNAANSSAASGTRWRAHLAPDKAGKWIYQIEFLKGELVAVTDVPWSVEFKPYHGKSGSFEVGPSDKAGRDFRGKGRLSYVGKHHLQFQGDKSYFLKAGPDAPETLLAFEDFDSTYTRKTPLKKYAGHLQDWNSGDPTWQNGKGKGLIGALNYLAGKGINAFSFLTYNAGGDGDNVWPFISRDEKYHYDCSKLDQWQIVFDHAQSKGLYLHFKMQENEIDDNRRGAGKIPGLIPESLDGGILGPQRRLYCRELIARFGYALALNWNLGEENTQSTGEQQEMATYIDELYPYPGAHIIVHTFPNQQDNVYPPLLGTDSKITGPSLQNSWKAVHRRTLQWLKASREAGRPWVVANDEQNSASEGVPPDPDYKGYDANTTDYSIDDIRKQTLWGNLMAGGAGVEYYFGYRLPENDLLCEDFRSRDQSWNYCRIALEFFEQQKIPFWEMSNHNALIENSENTKDKFCLARPGELYLLYLAYVNHTVLDLSDAPGTFEVHWYNPRTGRTHGKGTIINGGAKVNFDGAPDEEDWIVLVRKQ